MIFHVLTLFPQMITEATSHSIIGRAIKAGLVDVHCVNIRDFAVNRHGQVDDAPYGGGAGMVMMAPPVYDAYQSLQINTGIRSRLVYLSPQGRPFNQALAAELANEPELVLLCGHYEGLDERVIEEIVTDEISVGDYVLTGGELAALIIIDAVSRLLPGVLGKDASHQDESFSGDGLLEYPQYTRPAVFRDKPVPPVLLSGHHRQIDEWRRAQSQARTRRKRPDLLGLLPAGPRSAEQPLAWHPKSGHGSTECPTSVHGSTEHPTSRNDSIGHPPYDLPAGNFASRCSPSQHIPSAIIPNTKKSEVIMILSQCEPKQVFRCFEAISQIPRGSGNEKAVSDYIAEFARAKGMNVTQDERYNLVIYVPGTPGYEDHETLILQGHMDMVCEKNKGTVHDFLHDPIKLCVTGDRITADGTTLGADNGIAVAMCMAILETENIAHPPLELLLTTDEEAGMSGVEHLDAGLLKGRRMINMDTVTEGTFFAGCAGGVKVAMHIPAEWENADNDAVFYSLEVTGLKGGHSGEEINNERGNSIRLLARVLRALCKTADIRLASLGGGMKLNAIPREAEALLALRPGDAAKLIEAVEKIRNETAVEYRVSDPGLTITCKPAEQTSAKVLTAACGAKVVNALLLLPNGVQAMSMDIPGMVETSNNIGVLETKDDEIVISLMPRSSVMSRMALLVEQFETMSEMLGAKVVASHQYQGWAYDPDSKLRKTAVALYTDMYGKAPTVTAIHAGLECGLMLGKIPDLDIISFGPNASDLHTPDESLSISSTARVWDFLLALLKTL